MATTSLYDDYATQKARYESGTASAQDILSVLKRKRKEQGVNTDALAKMERAKKDRQTLYSQIQDAVGTGDFKEQQKEMELAGSRIGVSPSKIAEAADNLRGVAEGRFSPGPMAPSIQEQKKQQIRSNVQKMKDSRYESQKAAQASRWQEKWDDMDKQKKLIEKILAQRAKSYKERQAVPTKTKPPTGTTTGKDSAGQAVSEAPNKAKNPLSA